MVIIATNAQIAIFLKLILPMTKVQVSVFENDIYLCDIQRPVPSVTKQSNNARNHLIIQHMTKIVFFVLATKYLSIPFFIPFHKVEGSRAFTRYRTIDIDMKKDLVKILEGKK